jgi:hypothetical protein
MKDSPTKEPTLSPEEEQELASIEEDIRRHRVMKGHPPEGEIFQMPSEEEIKERIAELNKSAGQLTKQLADYYAKNKALG